MQQLKRFSLLVLLIAVSGIAATYAQTIFRARPVGNYSRSGMYMLSKIVRTRGGLGMRPRCSGRYRRVRHTQR